MAFKQDQFVVLAGQGKRGEAFQTCGYLTKDSKEDILTAGYFNELKGKVSTNDVISVYDNTDGAKNSYVVVVSSVDIYGNVEVEDSSSVVTSVNGRSGDVILDSSDVGLENVDNTSDADKPISDATQVALDAIIADIATNTSNIASNTTDISTNSVNIASNTSDITTNTLAIASNDTDIADLKSVDNIDLPINDTIKYAGEFDASEQFRLQATPIYDYDTYSYAMDGTDLLIKDNVNFTGDEFVFDVKFNATSFAGYTGLFSQGTEFTGLALVFNSGVATLYMSSTGSTWDIVEGAISSYTFLAGIDYIVRLEKDTPNAKWYLKYSIDDGNTFITAITVNSSLQLATLASLCIGANVTGGDNYLAGTYYLNKTSLTVNGVQEVRPQDTDYLLNTAVWKGAVRSDDNTVNITATDYVRSPVLSGGTGYTDWYLFVGFDNDIDQNVILEWDTDIDGANLSTITGAKRRIGDDKDVSFPTDSSGDLAPFTRNFGTWEFELWDGNLTAGSDTLNTSIYNYNEVDLRGYFSAGPTFKGSSRMSTNNLSSSDFFSLSDVSQFILVRFDTGNTFVIQSQSNTNLTKIIGVK